MKFQILKQAVIGAVLALSASAASAQSVTFTFNYQAGISAAAANTATILSAANVVASGPAGYSLGTLTLTDLSDLNLGDGKTGVRSSLNLDFSPITKTGGLGNSVIYLSSYELNFLGTNDPELSSLPNTVGPVNLGNNDNWRHVSGTNLSNIRAGGAIEFAENGNINGWGLPNNNPAFEQEINFAAGSFTGGNSTIDFLNGGSLGYNGFSVAALLANPVDNPNLDALNPTLRPDALSWLKIRSANNIGTGLGINPTLPGLSTAANITTGVTTQSLNVLAAVPEPETYAMMLAGLGLIGFSARRRRSA
ncbi:MAG TPA: PEPxxWA-CTERM sorting domain-containing protein [Methylotenera sp.]|nr:PEPxxWA-CTERM sorting domain-containing protein [Methylotenera sp.]HPM48867.1 PEPxxWA-CTERM sorting domain-containing protein [Methylotenera sp.]